ncbi:MAG: hypothetical protein NZ651_05875 [Candidatus Bipolaricaulota bacterium]|nr:hypothetical protein [Candidatus Bipolaricaulota bacterium]MDW8127282.1 hypothetical protein [Candidatus Bipolaricaulota bacterium]
MVYNILFSLAEETICLNKEKQAEMKSLFAWFEAALQVQPDKHGNTGVEALTGKTLLKNHDAQKSPRCADGGTSA